MQTSVYDQFMDLLIENVKSTLIGNGFDEGVTCGPIVSELAAGSSFRDTWSSHAKVFDRSRKPNSIRCGVT